MYRVWRFTVLQQELGLKEIPKMIAFCDFLVKRQSTLYKEYKDVFVNVYGSEAATLLRDESQVKWQ